MPAKIVSTRTARPHITSRPNRTARRLLKVAGLGAAGLLAGFLAGCSRTPAPTLTASHHIENLEDKSIPDLRHAPVAHRVHYDATSGVSSEPDRWSGTKPSAGHPMPVNDRMGHYSYASTTNSGQ
jgi:hypothetical protein